MRQTWAWWAAGSGLVASLAVACGPTDSSCDETATCQTGSGGASGRSGAGGTSGVTGTGGIGGGLSKDASAGAAGETGASGSGGNPSDADSAVCNGTDSPAQSPCVIDSQWGVFVSPTGNDTTGSGAKEMPYKTIGKGLLAAKTASKRLYV